VTAGATVTLNATVTSIGTPPNSSETPTGSVSFYDGSTLIGTAVLASGTGNTATAVSTTNTLNRWREPQLNGKLCGHCRFGGQYLNRHLLGRQYPPRPQPRLRP
jgi:hypothetical protein